MTNDHLLTEEYIGKIPELVEISGLFDKMIARARKIPNKMNPNTWVENNIIQKNMCKLFGLKKFIIQWGPETFAGAGTIPDSLLFGDDCDYALTRAARQKGRGFYDTTHKLIFIFFMSASIMIEEYGMTGGELTAIILHEIGHNFDYSLASNSKAVRNMYIKSMMNDFGASSNPALTNAEDGGADAKLWDMNNNYREFKQEQVDWVKYRDAFWYDHQKSRNRMKWEDIEGTREFMNSKRKMLAVAFKLAKTNLWLFITRLGKKAYQVENLLSRRGEQFADSFAACYGYGTELTTALNKLGDRLDKLVDDTSKSGKIIRDFYKMNEELNSFYLDEHATTQARVKDCLVKLKRDMASGDYSPEMKGELADEISRLEAEYTRLLNCNPDMRISFTRGFRNFIEKWFDGRMEVNRKLKPNQM